MKSLGRFGIAALWLVAIAWFAGSLAREPRVPSLEPAEREPQSLAADERFETSSFKISVAERSGRLHLSVVEPATRRVVWESPGDVGFVTLALSRLRYDDRHQSFAVEFPKGRECRAQKLESVSNSGGTWIVRGRFSDRGCGQAFEAQISEPKIRDLRIEVKLDEAFEDPPTGVDRDLIDFNKKRLPEYPVLTVHGRTRFAETIFGGGAQMSHFELNGRYVPLVVREQGIGRGLAHPLLKGLEVVAPGASGDPTSTYAPSPVFVTTDNRSFVVENYEPAVADFRKRDRASFSVRTTRLRFNVLMRESLPSSLTAITDFTGRMKPLPDWFNRGAILGVQGGARRVLRVLETATASGVPVAGVWIQDWVGRRQIDVAGFPIGSFLWWIWESDEKLYPNWPGFVASLAKRNVRTLAYMNPYLVDASERPSAKTNLFAEAERNGHLVRDSATGRAWIGTVIHFPASLVDLSNERAYDWMKGIVRERIVKAGVSGMMTDFGEALPYDSRLSEGRATSFHNRFPERWASLPVEAAGEAGAGDDFVSFSRSGYLRGPASTRLFWLGDQLTTWDAHDGLKSSLIGLLSSGLSGHSLNHSDVGGYTAVAINQTGIRRTKELFMRWTELNAFTTALRTHEGSRPDLHHQFDTDDETLRHFAKFASVFATLAPYRKTLMSEAHEKGWPLVRPMAFYHQNDVRVRTNTSQFYLGADLLVAPVLDSRASRVKVWLPEGEWARLWDPGQRTKVTRAGWVTVDAPIGRPAVFYRSDSAFARSGMASKIDAL